MQAALGVSERRACRTLGQPRATQRRMRRLRDDEAALTEAIVGLAAEYGRYGYRRITAMLRADGWRVNAKRVQRIWRREGLKVPKKQPKRGRLWLNDGSCIRLRPCWPGHIWAYDFVQDRTSDGRPLRMLAIIDEYTRKCLAIVVARRLTSDDVLQALTDLFVEHGPPDHIRSDNGGEFTAKVVRAWLGRIGVRTLFIERGSPGRRMKLKSPFCGSVLFFFGARVTAWQRAGLGGASPAAQPMTVAPSLRRPCAPADALVPAGPNPRSTCGRRSRRAPPDAARVPACP